MSAPRLTGIARFGEPVSISPLIKFGRWTALLLGITYGYSRNKFLQRRADKFKEIRDKRKAERLQREATAKAEAFKTEMQNLEKVTGVKLI